METPAFAAFGTKANADNEMAAEMRIFYIKDSKAGLQACPRKHLLCKFKQTAGAQLAAKIHFDRPICDAHLPAQEKTKSDRFEGEKLRQDYESRATFASQLIPLDCTLP
jgi:hypothetical protein